MKDLNKIRERYENEIKMAKIANNFEAAYNIEPIVIDNNGDVIISVNVDSESAKRILNGLQATEKFVINGTATGCKGEEIRAFYKLSSVRAYADRFSFLEIKFKSGSLWYWLHLQINYNSVLEPFFVDGVRNITDSERTTYKPTKRGICVRNYDIPCKRFKGEQIIYYGGYFVSTDCTIINDIIEAIKNS